MAIDATATKIRSDSAVIDYENYFLLAYGNVVFLNNKGSKVTYSTIKIDLNKAKTLDLDKDGIGVK